MQYTTLYYILLAAGVVLDFLFSLLIASAAQRKDRSFAAFLWISFALGLILALVGLLIPALVVAALPFRDDDPRHPANKRGR